MFAGRLTPSDAGRQTDMKRLKVGGRLRLGTTPRPGEYALQVVVRDSLAGEGRRTATRWVGLEVL